MPDTPKKKGFDWQEGGVLDEGNFSPLGGIRAHGLPKVNKAVAKDPAVRKQERERFLAEKQSQPYKQQLKQKADNIIVEESASGLSGDFEDSEVKRLTGKGNKIKGIDLFGKK